MIVVGFLSGCSTTEVKKRPGASSDLDLSSAREVVLTVHGLSCPLCSNNLDGQLKKVAGVESSSIDLKTGAVSVRLVEGHSVSHGDLASAVENAGFTLKKIEPKKAE
jgi:copper chaperone CopZ